MMLAVPAHDPSESTGTIRPASLMPDHHTTTTGSNTIDRNSTSCTITEDNKTNNNIIHNNDTNKLVLWQGIALLTADCVGVGILGLPNDVEVLGWIVGLTFLVGNLPINYYAGNLLSNLALDVEQDRLYTPAVPERGLSPIRQRPVTNQGRNDEGDDDDPVRRTFHSSSAMEVEMTASTTTTTIASNINENVGDGDDTGHSFYATPLGSEGVTSPKPCHRTASSASSSGSKQSFNQHQPNNNDGHNLNDVETFEMETFHDEDVGPAVDENLYLPSRRRGEEKDGIITDEDNDKRTSDLINISSVVFDTTANASLGGGGGKMAYNIVMVVYYTNLFLVLGDYILVMGRSISAVFLDEICLPIAGIVATVLMFGLCQYRSMANLGRSLSTASLLALLIVLIQCLFHHHRNGNNDTGRRLLTEGNFDSTISPVVSSVRAEDEASSNDNNDVWGKFSSLAGIGFAVGSQKLLLNIRHELQHREEASQVLAGSLTCYGLAYVIVIVLAGPDPPSFLFDAIPEGLSRRVAGFLLWFHVAVSFAINCQALCASLDQGLVTRRARIPLDGRTGSHRPCCCGALPSWLKSIRCYCCFDWCDCATPGQRWLVLTLGVCISSYLVSNAVPFFKDLVGLIGALTSVPLTLTLPALLHRKARHLRLLLPTIPSLGSSSLFLYSLVFLAIGLVGAISSIDEDWLGHGRPFSCR